MALPTDTASAEFHEAYAAAMRTPRRSAQPPTGDHASAAGTFGALLRDYYTSRDFRGLEPQTQADYRSTLKDFEGPLASGRVETFRKERLEAYLDKRAERAAASLPKFMKRFRALLRFARARGYRVDPLLFDVRVRRVRGGGFPDWTEDELARFEARWPIGTRERLAFALALYTGQRKSDVLRMGRQHIQGGRIGVRQQKTGKLLSIAIHPELQRVLDAVPPDQLVFVQTQYGEPFSEKAFGHWFAERVEAAGIHGKRMHGLRKAAARRLAEAGCTAHEIAAVTGHSSLKELEVYTRQVDQVGLADAAIRKVSGTKLSNRSRRNVSNRA